MNYLHPSSLQRIDHYIALPAQSTLIVGEQGIGFQAAINHIAEQFGVIPYVVRPEKGTLTAETIRTLYDVTRGRRSGKQLVVIDDADMMSTTAQNAFLKLLEEPSPSTYFILLSHNPTRLLPTIRSRVATISMVPVTTEQSQSLLDQLGVKGATKRQQLLFIADGLPALLTSLAQDDGLFQVRAQGVRDARTFLQGTVYERLKVAQTYKDRPATLTLLEDAARFLRQSTSPTNASTTLKRLDTLLKSYERIEANGNIRLWLAMAAL